MGGGLAGAPQKLCAGGCTEKNPEKIIFWKQLEMN